MWFPGTYSYSRLMVHNDTHLQWQQVMALTGEVVDEMVLVQTQHGPFPPITEFPPPPFLAELEGYWAIILLALGVLPAVYVLWRKCRRNNNDNNDPRDFDLALQKSNAAFYFHPVNSYQSIHLSTVV